MKSLCRGALRNKESLLPIIHLVWLELSTLGVNGEREEGREEETVRPRSQRAMSAMLLSRDPHPKEMGSHGGINWEQHDQVLILKKFFSAEVGN